MNNRGPRNEETWIPTATYEEPPFPIIEGTVACQAMKLLALKCDNIRESVNTMDVLKTIFQNMGDRDCVTDPWLQKRVAFPSLEAVEEYQKGLLLFARRRKDFPRSPRDIRNYFSKDPHVVSQVAGILSTHARTPSSAELKNIIANLLEDAYKTPEVLDHFLLLVEQLAQLPHVVLKTT